MLDQAGDSSEKDRLDLLQRYYDAWTIRKLEELGVAPGWRCFDVGAGAGSIARWLADRVAPSGSVLAVDLDMTLLEPLASETISVRRHDVCSDDLPPGADLVHVRLLLEHLPDPEGVVRRLIRALRPGGCILLTDTDFTTVALHEPDARFDRVSAAFAGVTQNAGWNIRLGPFLGSLLERAGLNGVGAESWQSYGRAAPEGRLLAMTYRRLRDKLIACGAKPSDVDEVAEEIATGRAGTYAPTTWMAWGRR
jgi:SAM-dependent methyltransferase